MGEVTQDTSPRLVEPGTIVGARYRIDRALGRGGMGAVYAATHVMTGKEAALKVMMAAMSDDPKLVARFIREARTASTISHPNAIQVLDVFRERGETGAPVMVMELLHGENLAQRIDRAGRLHVAELARVCVPVLGALAVAHSKGIVHRDLKPDNIFLAEVAGAVVPKVLDFGIAKVLRDPGTKSDTLHLTNTGTMLGTPYYMSPEQASGRPIDHRTDLWSMGVVMFEALAGQRPFMGDNFGQLFAAVLQDDPGNLGELAPETPDAVRELVYALLAKKPDRRPASAGEVAAVLAPYAEMKIEPLPPPIPPRLSQPGTAEAPTAAHRSAPGQSSGPIFDTTAPTVAAPGTATPPPAATAAAVDMAAPATSPARAEGAMPALAVTTARIPPASRPRGWLVGAAVVLAVAVAGGAWLATRGTGDGSAGNASPSATGEPAPNTAAAAPLPGPSAAPTPPAAAEVPAAMPSIVSPAGQRQQPEPFVAGADPELGLTGAEVDPEAGAAGRLPEPAAPPGRGRRRGRSGSARTAATPTTATTTPSPAPPPDDGLLHTL